MTQSPAPRESTTAQVLEFSAPEFRAFDTSPSLDRLLHALWCHAGNKTAVTQLAEAWTRHKAKLPKNNALGQFCAFLDRTSFVVTPPPKHHDRENEAQIAALLDVINKVLGPAKPLMKGDACYYFPAAEPICQIYEEQFGDLNPIPVITRALKAVFGAADDRDDERRREMQIVQLTQPLRRLLRDVCKWVSSTCERQTKTAVEACLLLSCGLEARCKGGSLAPGDPRTVYAALAVDKCLRNVTLTKWFRAISDYDTDDGLVAGLNVLCRFSIRESYKLDRQTKNKLTALGFSPPSDHLDALDPDVIVSAVVCARCRGYGMEDTVPPFVGELPRLLHELGALGKVDMEGRSPLSSNDAYLIADSLAGFGGAHELSLDDCHCEHIVLALAFCRDGGFESNLFDVRDYIRGPSSVWFMDARERMNVYRRFAAAATELGLSELAAAAWAFFITSQTIAFKGQLKADWSELSAQLRNSLHGPGGRILGAAISLSAQHAEEMSEQINALRLRGLLPESPSIPNHRPPISVASLRIPDKREEADMALRELVGEDGWKKLQAKTRDHFVDAWIQLRQLRPGPVNPDIKNGDQ